MKALSVVVMLGTAFLAGCESGDIKAAKESVANQLRDPGSAQFRNITETSQMTMPEHYVTTVCGEVNGKNAYGGYAGFQRFVSRPSVSQVYMEKSWRTFDDIWASYCTET